MSKFGRLQKNLDDQGAVKYRSIYVTQDISLKKGDIVFVNPLAESLDKDVEFNYITAEEKLVKMAQIASADAENGRETTHVLKLGKRKEIENNDCFE